jgi:DNA-directed RNA polymerase subunit M/transcription elongation factor TFIIS
MLSVVKMTTHPYRTFVQAAFAKAIGHGPIARNAEISVVNWTRERVPYEDASWESSKFRTQYKSKAMGLIKELERDVTTIVPNIRVDGDRVVFEYRLVPQLVRKLQLKQLDSKRLAWYPAEILWSDGPTAKAIIKNREHDMHLEEIKSRDEDYDGILQCRKCKSNKTEYYQLQTRSADEPMVRFLRFFFPQVSNALFQTTYATCKKCGNKWKC